MKKDLLDSEANKVNSPAIEVEQRNGKFKFRILFRFTIAGWFST
jgi:hypothetical protein